jgi:cysteinyl-tRNA synthetase
LEKLIITAGTMKFHNTMNRKLEEFTPIDNNHVRMYTCGPTVYNYAHIGNFRAYIFEDLLRRYLQYHGWKVTQVMNLTDVDDKTIKSAIAEGKSLNDYTKTYKDAFFDDLKTLNIEPAEYYPAATDHIPEMIELIQTLLDKEYAYKSDDGSIYFSIEKFTDYGKLAHLDMSGLRAGARVTQDEYEKDNASDFALWKAWDEADGDVVWDAPWGKGRPGWHIECSAMSTKYLGETFDIHTGGIDNIFPHHEDEIAQSEAASGKKFVNMWMHCAHLVVEGKKMSKSAGNFFTLRDIKEKGYSGREIRYILIGTHYRQSLNFTFSGLEAARTALGRIDEFKERLAEKGSATDQPLPDWALKAQKSFEAAMDNDLNISEALAAIFELVHNGNKVMDNSNELPAANAVLALLERFDQVLGCLQSKKKAGASDEVLALAAERTEVRKAKNWARADEIRNRLTELGWEVRDTPEGPKLKALS